LFFDKELFKKLKRRTLKLSEPHPGGKVASKKPKVKKTSFPPEADSSLTEGLKKTNKLNKKDLNPQGNYSVYQPTNIINTKKITFKKNNKRWQRVSDRVRSFGKEFIKNNTFLEPDPLLDWRVYGKMLSPLPPKVEPLENIIQKGGSGYDLL